MQLDLERKNLARHDVFRLSCRFLCVPLKAAPATCVTCPSGATSEILTTQLARVASAETLSVAIGLPSISSGAVSGSLSYTRL